MILRSSGHRSRNASLRLAGLRLLVVLAAAALVCLLGGAGTSRADVTSYNGTLYLTATPSAALATSYQLQKTAGPGASVTTPTAALNGAGLVTGSGLQYLYTIVDPTNGETAPHMTPSGGVSPSSNAVNVGNLATGKKIRIYRGGSGTFKLVDEIANNASAIYTDNIAVPGALLPWSQNRTPSAATGYADFSPGSPVPDTTSDQPASMAASPVLNNKGWIVEGTGGLTFPAGQWTFQAKFKLSASAILSSARMAVGMWAVKTSGGSITSSRLLLDPSCAPQPGCSAAGESASFVNSSALIQAKPNLGKITLARDEHLYVQFFRHQALANAAGAANRLATMFTNDGNAAVIPTTANAFPSDPSTLSPANAAHVMTATPTLSADFTDSGDTGTVGFRLCSDLACGTVLQTGTSGSVSSGSSGTWAPTALTDGATYYWQAQATDSLGGQSYWSVARSFTVDLTPPSVPTLGDPADAVHTSSSTLAASFDDGIGGTGTVTFQLCQDALCATVLDSATSATISSGASATWTPASIADGLYHWRAQAHDAAGNASAWSATHAFTLDRVAPDTTITAQPPALAASTTASFSFSSPDPDATGFECALDSTTDYSACTSPQAYTGLGQGGHTFRVRAVDAAQNKDATPAPATWTVDTVPPETTITATPASLVASASASFSFSSESGATFQCSLDSTTAYSACTSPASYTVSNGNHTFRVKATDAAGNTDPTPDSYTWHADLTVPSTPALGSPAAGAQTSSSTLTAGFGDADAGDTGTVTFRVCPDPLCATVSATGASSTVATGSTASWTISPAILDGTYYWQASAQDAAGNGSSWSATRSFTLDTTAPNTSIGAGAPAPLSASASASFSFSSTESGSTFECSLDSGAFAACTSPKSYSGLGEGGHAFAVRATDVAGNTDATPASYSWTVDTVAPETSLSTSVPAASASAAASFDFISNEAGSSFQCSLDSTTAYGACTSPQLYAGLAEGSHTFRVKATDAAGNTDATPASYTWNVDVLAPAVPTLLAPGAGAQTTSSKLSALFADPDSADTGTIEFRICSDPVCGVVVASGSSPSTSNGVAASWTMSTLVVDGSYYWQARARDAVGNVSAWSASRSFTRNTAAPNPPSPQAPADGARAKTATLTARFTDPDAADTGTLSFRVCSDEACAKVVRTAATGPVANGASATVTISPALADGTYWWQAHAEDAAGSGSAWSPSRRLTIDTVAPGAPAAFGGSVDGGALTLHWEAPAGDVAQYVVFVDGIQAQALDGATLQASMGAFDAGDSRTFAVQAVDAAGNAGAKTQPLVGVPSLVGLSLDEGAGSLRARGLQLDPRTLGLPGSARILAQDPVAPGVAPRGTAIGVVVAGTPLGAPAPLIQTTSPTQASCMIGRNVLLVHISLSRRASVSWRLLDSRGEMIASRRVGTMSAGASDLKLVLPRGLRRPGSYRVVVSAVVAGQRASTTIRVSMRSLHGRTDAGPICGAPDDASSH